MFRSAYPFQDIGVHGLCLLEAFLGPVRAADIRYASTGRDVKLLFDEWRATVDCENGTGHMYLSWNERPMQNLLIVHGTHGVMYVDCVLQSCTIRKAYSAPKPVEIILGAVGASAATLSAVARNVFRFATGKLVPSPGIHHSVCEFYRSLAAGIPPPVRPDEARRMVDVLQPAAMSPRAPLARPTFLSRAPAASWGGLLSTACENQARRFAFLSGDRCRVGIRTRIWRWSMVTWAIPRSWTAQCKESARSIMWARQ